MRVISNHYYLLLFLAGLFTLVGCTTEDDASYDQIVTGDVFTIKAVSRDMMVQQVTTRSNIIKNEEESKINQLYLFFFDEDGYYLESDESDNLFKGYMAPSQGMTSINIPTGAFTGENAQKAAKTIIYALANVTSEIVTTGNDGYPINFPKEGKDGKSPKDLFDEYLYDPTNYNSYSRDDITKLPAEGMPMVGKATETVDLTEKGSFTLQLKALMARIDISISVESDYTDDTNLLPRLQMADWGVYNMPTAIPFTEPVNGVSTLNGKKRNIENIQNNGVVYNHGEELKLTFYMFENLQEPTISSDDYTYPAGISNDDKQRWKPELAGPDATYFKMHAFYTTYNGDPSLPVDQDNSTIEAEFTFYLGADHTDDFKVGRNRHYQNNITINGLTQVGNASNHVTFDARVNISSQSNAYHVAILRERDHDAHFCVTPMDVYFFETDQNPKMTVSIEDPDNHRWIRMEKVPSVNMENGTLPDGWTSDDHLSTGERWHAGNGKRKYFTYDLVTNSLASNTTCQIDNSRDRIYFYLDENLSTQERTANIILTYTADNQNTPQVKNVQIVQNGLLPVIVPGDEDNPSQQIYIEVNEEYLQHYDPLDEFVNEAYYDGLEWGLDGQYLNNGFLDPSKYWCEVYYNGLEATAKIVSYGQSEMNLNEKPESAAEYCYNKNKRDGDGNALDSSGKLISTTSKSGWFLPGIRQLESILTTYYYVYPEFQQRFYWSSSAAKRNRLGYEDPNYARATKALDDGVSYAESDWNQDYTDENGNYGKTSRTGKYLRIRAAYIPAANMTIE